jgi:hypothetical protein
MRRDTRSAKACQAHLGAHLIEEWEHDPDYVLVSHGAFGAARKLHKAAMLGAPTRVGPEGVPGLLHAAALGPTATPAEPGLFAMYTQNGLTALGPQSEAPDRPIPLLPGSNWSSHALNTTFPLPQAPSSPPDAPPQRGEAQTPSQQPGGSSSMQPPIFQNLAQPVLQSLSPTEEGTQGRSLRLHPDLQAAYVPGQTKIDESPLGNQPLGNQRISQSYNFHENAELSTKFQVQKAVQARNAVYDSAQKLRDFLTTQEGRDALLYIDDNGTDSLQPVKDEDQVQKTSPYDVLWDFVKQKELELAEIIKNPGQDLALLQKTLKELNSARGKLHEGRKLKRAATQIETSAATDEPNDAAAEPAAAKPDDDDDAARLAQTDSSAGIQPQHAQGLTKDDESLHKTSKQDAGKPPELKPPQVSGQTRTNADTANDFETEYPNLLPQEASLLTSVLVAMTYYAKNLLISKFDFELLFNLYNKLAAIVGTAQLANQPVIHDYDFNANEVEQLHARLANLVGPIADTDLHNDDTSSNKGSEDDQL